MTAHGHQNMTRTPSTKQDQSTAMGIISPLPTSLCSLLRKGEKDCSAIKAASPRRVTAATATTTSIPSLVSPPLLPILNDNVLNCSRQRMPKLKLKPNKKSHSSVVAEKLHTKPYALRLASSFPVEKRLVTPLRYPLSSEDCNRDPNYAVVDNNGMVVGTSLLRQNHHGDECPATTGGANQPDDDVDDNTHLSLPSNIRLPPRCKTHKRASSAPEELIHEATKDQELPFLFF